ncbi:hypothetical protein ZWY2020_054286 [Hordeum vulgare]|nr:hypothetical protein ZWY2020_054286 [Hordeum vulgare]
MSGARLANFAGPAQTAVNGARSPSPSKRRSNRSFLLPPHSLILSLSLFLLLSPSHHRRQRHCCRLKLKMSFYKEEESSDEDICMVSVDQQLFASTSRWNRDMIRETPDTVVDPSFCGSFPESEPTCVMHHQRPKKMVAFRGSLTGRRFLGCLVQQDEGVNCGVVEWVDAPWPDILQSQLVEDVSKLFDYQDGKMSHDMDYISEAINKKKKELEDQARIEISMEKLKLAKE